MTQNIIQEVKLLQLPLGEYAVISGGVLSVRGIRPHNDIDIIVTNKLYKHLKEQGWDERKERGTTKLLYNGNVEVAKDFSNIPHCSLYTETVLANADIIDGVPFMSLTDLLILKQAMGREKDQKDIRLIEQYIQSTTNKAPTVS